MAKTKQTQIRFTEEAHEALTKEAERRKVSMAWIVRLAVEEWLANEGYELKDKIEWGGIREVGQDET